jgi:hypothetical protein
VSSQKISKRSDLLEILLAVTEDVCLCPRRFMLLLWHNVSFVHLPEKSHRVLETEIGERPPSTNRKETELHSLLSRINPLFFSIIIPRI